MSSIAEIKKIFAGADVADERPDLYREIKKYLKEKSQN